MCDGLSKTIFSIMKPWYLQWQLISWFHDWNNCFCTEPVVSISNQLLACRSSSVTHNYKYIPMNISSRFIKYSNIIYANLTAYNAITLLIANWYNNRTRRSRVRLLQLFHEAQPSAITGVIALYLYMQLDSRITPRFWCYNQCK